MHEPCTCMNHAHVWFMFLIPRFDRYTRVPSRETGSRESISAHAIMPYKEQPITERDQVTWEIMCTLHRTSPDHAL